MGMHHKDIESMESNFPFIHDRSRPESFRLFIIGSDRDLRLEASKRVKTMLEGMLEDAKTEKKVMGYEVQIVDLETAGPDVVDEFSPFWSRIGNKDGNVFVPIYHNADRHPDLAQMAFDGVLPGIYSVSPEGYGAVVNHSKRDTFDTLRL